MSINIKSLKNYKKIAKEFKKVLKQQLREKPKSVIGIESTNNFLKVTNNLKKIIKLNWYYTHIFPLATYLEQQKIPLDKELAENFVKKIYMPPSNYQDIHKLALRLFLEKKPNDLFLFDNLGGIDLLIFFIDFRGNFVFNDYESKKTFLNKTNNGSDLVSIGIKSILTAKKIICFCIDEASKDVVFKLNKRLIDTDDTLTYLHLHNDVTLFTLNSIISKNEINYDPMTQDKMKFLNELDDVNDDVDISAIEKQTAEDDDEDEIIHTNIENVNLDSANENMNNLDKSLFEELEKEKDEEINLENDDEKPDSDDYLNEKDFDEDEIDFLTDSEVEEEIEQKIFDIRETADELKEEIYEVESNVEEVGDFIDQIDSDLDELEDKEENFDEQKTEEKDFEIVEYTAQFLYSEPKNFDFSTWTWVNDERNKGYLAKKIGDFNSKKVDTETTKNIEITDNVKKENKVEKDEPIESTDTLSNAYDDNKKLNIDELPNNPEDIYRYLIIKNETLGQVEKLLLNNKLGKIESELLKEMVEQNLGSFEKRILGSEISKLIKKNKNITNKNNYVSYKLSYIPGFRPTPLLMVWYDVNKKFYDDLVQEMEQNLFIKFTNSAFDEQVNHIWNDSCYMVYNPDSLSIRALAFSSIEKLIYLLRHVNKNLTMRIADEQTYQVLSNLLIGWESEIKVEKN